MQIGRVPRSTSSNDATGYPYSLWCSFPITQFLGSIPSWNCGARRVAIWLKRPSRIVFCPTKATWHVNAVNFKTFTNCSIQALNFATFSISGKYVVLFFYPLDFTFVCPTEIIAFSDHIEDFRQINCEVIACSTDSHFSHHAWSVAAGLTSS